MEQAVLSEPKTTTTTRPSVKDAGPSSSLTRQRSKRPGFSGWGLRGGGKSSRRAGASVRFALDNDDDNKNNNKNNEPDPRNQAPQKQRSSFFNRSVIWNGYKHQRESVTAIVANTLSREEERIDDQIHQMIDNDNSNNKDYQSRSNWDVLSDENVDMDLDDLQNELRQMEEEFRSSERSGDREEAALVRNEPMLFGDESTHVDPEQPLRAPDSSNDSMTEGPKDRSTTTSVPHGQEADETEPLLMMTSESTKPVVASSESDTRNGSRRPSKERGVMRGLMIVSGGVGCMFVGNILLTTCSENQSKNVPKMACLGSALVILVGLTGYGLVRKTRPSNSDTP